MFGFRRRAETVPPVARSEPPPLRRMKISPELLAASRARPERAPLVAYDLPQALPGVVPAGATMAMDYGISEAYSFASASTWGGGEGLGFLGYPYLAELAQRPEYRTITETIAREMTRKWIKVRATGGEDKGDKIKQLEAALERYRVRDMFRRAAEMDGYFGRSHLFVDMGNDDPAELDTPLIRASAKITKGSLKSFRIVEPLWTYPSGYNSADPLSPDFYRPTAWYVMGKRVHASRLLTFVGREVPDMLKPAYAFGGLSMSQMAKPYVDNWLRTRQSVSDLVHSFSVSGIKTNMGATLQGEAGGGVFDRVQLFNQLRDNRGTMVLDQETEEFFNVSTPLGTLDHLQAQSQEQMGSVSGIPLVVLLGITPSGLNPSTDGEERVFHSRIEAGQQHLFRPNFGTVFEIVQLSEFGEIDPELTWTFERLWQLDDAARAAIRKTEADIDTVYMDGGVILPEEVRQRIASEEESPYPGLDLSVPAPGKPEPMGGNDPFGQESDPAGRETAPEAEPLAA